MYYKFTFNNIESTKRNFYQICVEGKRILQYFKQNLVFFPDTPYVKVYLGLFPVVLNIPTCIFILQIFNNNAKYSLILFFIQICQLEYVTAQFRVYLLLDRYKYQLTNVHPANCLHIIIGLYDKSYLKCAVTKFYALLTICQALHFYLKIFY